MQTPYPRDMVGYGGKPPHPRWPGGARIAVQFVFNYEEGSENTILDGDGKTEVILAETPGGRMAPGKRDLGIESAYEYGSRVGFWRLHRLFQERQIPVTVYACALALERNPAAAEAIARAGYEVAGHGWRWLEHYNMEEAEEREHIRRCVESITRTIGRRPLGWYSRYAPSLNTRRLLVEEGGFLYDSDCYNDELPYWVTVTGKPHLVVPYTLDCNDVKFSNPPIFASTESFYTYLKDNFDQLYHEGAESPKMLSIGLHMRLAGRPGRSAALGRFLDYMLKHDRVWFAKREEIARHWRETFPHQG